MGRSRKIRPPGSGVHISLAAPEGSILMLVRMLVWSVRRLGWPNILILALLLSALGSVVWGLMDAVRGLDAGLLLPLAALSLLLGLALARSPFPGWLAAGISVILGLEIVVIRVGQLGLELLSLVRLTAGLVWQVWRWPVAGPPEFQPLLLGLAGFVVDIATVLGRVAGWLQAVVAGTASFEPVAVAFIWALAVWLVTAWAGWAIYRRQQPLQAIAPAGTLLVVTLSYSGSQLWVLPVVLGATLLLMALIGHINRERFWQNTGIDYAVEVRLDLAVAVIPVALGLVLLAYMAPSVSLRRVARSAQELIWGQPIAAGPVAKSLGLQPRRGEPGPFDRVRYAGLPRRHLIGSGPELSQQLVMVIQTTRPEDGPGRVEAGSPVRRYWRSLTYNQYTGRGWVTGPTQTGEFEAGDPVSSVNLPGRFFQQEVRRMDSEEGGLVHFSGSLLTVHQDYRAALRSDSDLFGATVDTPQYLADSWLPVVSKTELRAAGSQYPDWVQRRYLVLPKQVPARVLGLARDLTATEPTPYDRARAIEAYLRRFPYTLDLPPPPDQDVVDYFLFEEQRGYCDYYATAMVVLARAAGLPARLVIGYVGESSPANPDRFVITEADAHAWPEIYFPDYGWIEFEPTAGRPDLNRPEERDTTLLAAEWALAAESTAGAEIDLSPVWRGLLAVLAILAVVGVGWPAADSWRLRRLGPAAAAAVLYHRLNRYGRRLKLPAWAGDTPYEFAGLLAGRLAALSQAGRRADLLAPAAQEIRRLADLYVQVSYSPHPPTPADQAQACSGGCGWPCYGRGLKILQGINNTGRV